MVGAFEAADQERAQGRETGTRGVGEGKRHALARRDDGIVDGASSMGSMDTCKRRAVFLPMRSTGSTLAPVQPLPAAGRNCAIP
jgi:hypothetical protein